MSTNKFNISLLPEALRSQLFGEERRASAFDTKICLEMMGDYKANVAQNTPFLLEHLPELPFKIGDNETINEVIEGLATERCGFIHEAVDRIIKGRLPFMPHNNVAFQPGWTKYTPTINKNIWEVEAVAAPDDDGVFDTETFVKYNQAPVIAVFRSPTARYVWLHPGLVDPSLPFDPRVRIPLGTGKVVIAHNSSFDRQTVTPQEEHPSGPWWTQRVWLDTMSMHTVCNGLADEQRTEWVRQSANPYANWFNHGSPKSLVEAWNFHVGKPFGRTLMSDEDKTLRTIFVDAQSITQIHNSLDKLIQYCILDVDHTWELFSELWHKYRYTSPSDIALAATCIMGQQVLPIGEGWAKWVDDTEAGYQALCKDIRDQLTALAKEKCDEFMRTGVRPDGPWMAQLDWTPAKTGKAKGMPAWWRNMKVGAEGVTPTGILAPLFLEVAFHGLPVFYHKVHKWGVLGEHTFGRIEKTDSGKVFTTIPHPKNGAKKNCGCVFAKDYADLWDDGTFDGTDTEIVAKLKVISYWRSVRERVMHQPVYQDGKGNLFVKPSTVVNGAGTRRATEALWLTVCGTKAKKWGSELKGWIRSHLGRKLVSFDFNSQESAIAAMFDDAENIGEHGSSVWSQVCYAGSKEKGTDAHTIATGWINQAYFDFSSEVPTSPFDRNESKPVTFSALYGSGVSGQASYVASKRPLWGTEACTSVAKAFLGNFKGKKDWSTGKYKGGVASNAFTAMEKRAFTGESRTPALNCAAPKALQAKIVERDFLPSRMNRLIQSSGVDLLYITLFIQAELTGGVHRGWPLLDGYFATSYHDEVLNDVLEADVRQWTKAMSLAHLYAWSMLATNLGFTNLPANYAFPQSVNVDTCFRKEVKDSQFSPSQQNWEPAPGLELKPHKAEFWV